MVRGLPQRHRLFGTSGFTTDHHEAFVAHGVTRVLIAYDHDTAGDTAAVTLARDLAAAGVECFRVLVPADQDINDVAIAAHCVSDAGREAGALGTPSCTKANRAPAAAPVPSGRPQFLLQLLCLPSRTSSLRVSRWPRPLRPPHSSDLPAAALSHDELVIEMGQRTWRVRHIGKATATGTLKVNVMVRTGERFHVDTLDLYAAKARAGFADAAATELRTDHEQLSAELGRVLMATETAQAAALVDQETPVPEVTGPERERAMALLEAPI